MAPEGMRRMTLRTLRTGTTSRGAAMPKDVPVQPKKKLLSYRVMAYTVRNRP